MNSEIEQPRGGLATEPPEISLVSPAYNEAGNIRRFTHAVREALEPETGNFELIFVDDGSSDGTWEQILAMHDADGRVKGLQLSRNFGKEAALTAGLDAARGAAVIVLDCDLQHPPAAIPQMVRAWREGRATVVEAVKRKRAGEPWLRKTFSAMFNRLARLMTGVDFANASDFKLVDRRALEALRQMPERRVFFRGMSAWVGFPRLQVEFDVESRAEGSSKWTAGRLLWLAWQAIVSYSSLPLRIIHLVGGGFMVLAVLLFLRAMQLWFAGIAVSGFTTVIILLLIVGGLVLICLAIIAEYVIAIYDEVKQRPRYVLRDSIR